VLSPALSTEKVRVMRDMVAYARVAAAEPPLRQGDLSWCDAARALHVARRGHPGSVPDIEAETLEAPCLSSGADCERKEWLNCTGGELRARNY
jgi:hypothetical protein